MQMPAIKLRTDPTTAVLPENQLDPIVYKQEGLAGSYYKPDENIPIQSYEQAFNPNIETKSYFPNGDAAKIQASANSPVYISEPESGWANVGKLAFLGVVGFFIYKYFKGRK